ncbi:hypothetical protein E2C01_019626 [Portunus trituberculatus]|uniref:Uncharacterized protein n=1 Tax=Portunus trituberculatus TaxID=210409 RepID=A0A5B7DZV9_PORTR|nr:hypothetical protein [Portunus trituberculatus]
MSVAHITCPSQDKASEMGQTWRLQCGQHEGREKASVVALAQMSLQLYKHLSNLRSDGDALLELSRSQSWE